MSALVLAIALAASPARAEPVAQWRSHVGEASARFGVPEAWIGRVMQIESGGRTRLRGRPITSPKGAMGLMQIMPATWAMLSHRHGLGNDPYEPRANILAGAAYLRAMHDRFGYPGLFGAYNAGPARYAAYLAGRQRLPAETRSYLAMAAGVPLATRSNASASATTTALSPPPQLFAIVRNPSSSPAPRQGAEATSALFVLLLRR